MRLVNLSVVVSTRTYGPPSTNLKVKMDPSFRGPGYWVSSSLFMSVHTGSHIDSPSHVFKNDSHVDSIPLENLVGKPLVLHVDVGESEGVTREQIARAPIHEGDIVLISTGWSDKMWGRFPDYYTRSPFLTEEAARYLASLRIRAVGFDFFEEYNARLPKFGSEDFVVHRILLGAGIILLEQMTNLSSLPEGSTLLAAPLRLQGVEGAPARFLGIVE